MSIVLYIEEMGISNYQSITHLPSLYKPVIPPSIHHCLYTRPNQKMKLIITLGLFAILAILGQTQRIDREVIQSYHFHTYYFQNNRRQLNAIKRFHDAVNHEVKNGALSNCALGQLHRGPVGPHATGMFLTCCNFTSVVPAVSFFMKNHDEFSVLMHALTTSERLDHSERAFWLGKSIPIDLDNTAEKLHETPTCPTVYDTWNQNDFFPEH